MTLEELKEKGDFWLISIDGTAVEKVYHFLDYGIKHMNLKEVVSSLNACFDNDNAGSSAYEMLSKYTFNLEKGDTVYTFTDGFADQFGGPKGKKFKYKRIQELILETRLYSISEQQAQMEKALNDWKQNYEQIDDILMMGIEF